MAQMSLLGVLLIGPLLYTQVLPLTLPPDPIAFFRPVGDPPPLPQKPSVNRSGSTQTLATAKTWVQPLYVTRAPTGPIDDSVMVVDHLGPAIAGVAINSPLPGLTTDGLLTSVVPGPPAPVPVAEPVNEPVITPPAETKAVRVSSEIQASKLIHRVLPVFPGPAKAVRASGTVRLLALIGTDGHVRKVDVLSGHPLLKVAAAEAVQQWIYSPTLLNGIAIEVEAPIDVNFSLR